jgi:hypothetical protein
MAGGTPANPARLVLVFLLGFRFLDQHYRYSVDDRIEDLAPRASQVVRLFELHFRVTFRAGEDFE